MIMVVETMPLSELWRTIFTTHVNAIPVIDKRKHLVGIVTKEDILKALYPDYQEYMEDISSVHDFEDMEGKVRELSKKKARDVMSKRVIFTRGETPIMRALSRMIVRRVDQLPILSDDNTVIGMVTKGDIFYALFKKNLAAAAKKPSEAHKKKK